MSDARLFAITGFGGGISIGLQADTYEEFVTLARQVFGDAAGTIFASEAFASLARDVSPTAAAAVVAGQTVGPVSVVGQLSQPQQAAVAPQPVAQPATNVVPLQQPAVSNPPTLPNPGPCAHGPRVYKSTRTKNGQWTRWECAIPWSNGATGRCEAINV